jgi:hypothetical protein
MTIFDLVFLLAALGAIVAVVRISYLLLRGRRAGAARTLRRLAIGAAAYFGMLAVVSITQPRAVVARGAPRCFDEWCIAVDGARRQSTIGPVRASGQFVIASVRVLNQGRGRRQRESDVRAELLDARGRRYPLSEPGQAAYMATTGDRSALTDFVDAGSSRPVQLVFDLPDDVHDADFLTLHGWFPNALIVGGAESVFHRPTVVPLRF